MEMARTSGFARDRRPRVVSRPGHRYNVPDAVRVHRLDILDLPVSSSGIRERLAAGDDRVDAPPAVLRYIVERNLYSPQI